MRCPFVVAIAVLAAGTTSLLFLQGVDELSDPLMSLGLTRREAFERCKWPTIGLAASKAGVEPIPFLGGVASAAASIARIAVAMRLLYIDHDSTATVVNDTENSATAPRHSV